MEKYSILVNDSCRSLFNENIFSTNREPPKGPVTPRELCWSVPGAVDKIHHRS